MALTEKLLGMLLTPDNWLGAMFYAIVMLGIAIGITRLIRMTTNRMLKREENALIDRTVVMFLTQFAQIAVYIVTLIVFFHVVPALNRLGTALLTGVSVMSVVFGLAAQNTLANLVAGCTLLLYRPFHLDDLVQVATPTGTEAGIIERLTLGYTMLRTIDDRLVVVPNSLMASQVSLNLNRKSMHIMAIVQVGVLDGGQAPMVRAALLSEAQANKSIHKVISCHSQALDDEGSILSLRAWCADRATATQVETEIFEAMQRRFASTGKILLAAPPRPVSVPAPAASAAA